MKKFLSFLYPFVRGTCTENGILDFSCRQVPIYNSFPFKEKHTSIYSFWDSFQLGYVSVVLVVWGLLRSIWKNQ